MDRLEIASKVLHLDIERTTKQKVCNEFALTEYEFDNMSDEEYFNILFEYCHNTSPLVAS